MSSQHPSPGSSESRSDTPSASQDMRAKAGDCASKIAGAAREAGDQAKHAASSLASDATKRAKGFINMQVTAGADMADHVVGSARIAAENLEQEAPQLAGLVRTVADRAEEFSQQLRGQTVEDLIKTASDFTRKQPALVFALASLAGFLAFRVLKSRPPEESAERGRGTERFERSAGQFQGGQFRGGQFHGA
jgi:chemotaxis regulatin CheY-phosphate phosphatase CheZ